MREFGCTKIKAIGTTRGNGKVFTLLDVKNITIFSWKVHARFSLGGISPVKIIQTSAGAYVLVTPVVTDVVLVDICFYDESENLVGSGEITINPHIAKMKSQLNTLLKNSKALGIRNCDNNWNIKGPHLSEFQIVSTGNPKDILQFSVTRTYQKEISSDDVEVYVLGVDSRRIVETCDAVVLGDGIFELQDYPEVRLQKTRFSVCIPARLTDFFICASINSLDDFVFIHGGMSAALRLGFQSNTKTAESDNRYQNWFISQRTSRADLALQRVSQKLFSIRPKFSIIVPLYHTPLPFFREMLSSVLSQTYDNYELILVNSTPEDDELTRECENAAASHKKIRLVTLDCNKGITENTNEGIAVSTGDFLSFFDHDDFLEPDILYWYVKGINDYPNTDMLYCDEDKFEDSLFVCPFFKPDWDPFFLETNNYLCHMLTVRRELVLAMERPNSQLDGAQDHNMALSIADNARNIYHARKILYHWRVHPQSTAASADAKPESLEAGRVAIRKHLSRINEDAEVFNIPDMPHCYRIAPKTVSDADVDLIIYGPSDSIVGSSNRIVEKSKHINITPILASYEEEKGCFDAIRDAVVHAHGEFVALICSESAPEDDSWLSNLLSMGVRRGVGVVAPVVTYLDGTVYDAGVVCSNRTICPEHKGIPSTQNGCRGLLRLDHTVQAVHGGCLLLNRDKAREVVSSIPACPYSVWDIAICLAMKERCELNTVLVPSVRVGRFMPIGDLSDNRRDVLSYAESERAWLKRNWPSFLSGADPYYNEQMRQDGYYGLAC